MANLMLDLLNRPGEKSVLEGFFLALETKQPTDAQAARDAKKGRESKTTYQFKFQPNKLDERTIKYDIEPRYEGAPTFSPKSLAQLEGAHCAIEVEAYAWKMTGDDGREISGVTHRLLKVIRINLGPDGQVPAPK